MPAFTQPKKCNWFCHITGKGNLLPFKISFSQVIIKMIIIIKNTSSRIPPSWGIKRIQASREMNKVLPDQKSEQIFFKQIFWKGFRTYQIIRTKKYLNEILSVYECDFISNVITLMQEYNCIYKQKNVEQSLCLRIFIELYFC